MSKVDLSTFSNQPLLTHSAFLLFYRLIICAFLMNCILACDDSKQVSQNQQVYEIEGPRGFTTERGPWLLRAGIDSNADYVRDLEANQEVSDLHIRWFVVPFDLEMNNTDEIVGVEGDSSIEVNKLILWTTGRKDTLLALLPEQDTNNYVYYSLWLGEQQLSPQYSFRYIADEIMLTDPEQKSCVLSLVRPELEISIDSSLDEAPQAGIQVTYQVQVYPLINEQIDEEGSQALMGLVSLEWLQNTESRMVMQGTVASINGGIARTAPFTTPIGEQKLLLRAFTTRWGQCERIVRLTIL